MYPSQRIIPKGNVAAVEPYIHMPQQKPIATANKHEKHQNLMQQQQKQHQKLIQDITNMKITSNEPNQNVNNNNNGNLNINGNVTTNHNQYPESDETKLARQILHKKQHSQDIDLNSGAGQDITDFVKSKTELKFQTLPYNSKSAPYHGKSNSATGTTSTSITTKTSSNNKKLSMEDRDSPVKYNGNDSDSQKIELETDTNSNGLRMNSQQQHQQLFVHGKTQNKSIPTSVANNNSTANAKRMSQRYDEKTSIAASTIPTATSPKSKLAATHQIPSGNLVVPPRKPISSVAPTTITLAPKSIMQSPRINAVAPSISTTASIVTATESSNMDKTRPALPPKPNKNSSDSSSNSSAETSPTTNASSSMQHKNRIPIATNVPTIVGVSEKLAGNETNQQMMNQQQIQSTANHMQTTNIDNFQIKAKPLTIKKQPLSEQPRLRSLTSGIKPIQYSSRRIEMPPAFLFPEIEKAKLKTGDDKVPSGISSTMDDNNKMPSPSASSNSSIDETDKSTNSSISSDTDKLITAPNGEVVRRQRSSMSDNTTKTKLTRRVSFDPLALLLDASLEGELELVQKTAMQVRFVAFYSFTYIESLFM